MYSHIPPERKLYGTQRYIRFCTDRLKYQIAHTSRFMASCIIPQGTLFSFNCQLTPRQANSIKELFNNISCFEITTHRLASHTEKDLKKEKDLLMQIFFVGSHIKISLPSSKFSYQIPKYELTKPKCFAE